MTTSPRTPTVSVIIATYNRGPLLLRLLRQIGEQEFPQDELEVVVVDDGSKVPVSELLRGFSPSYSFTLVRQANAGAAAARHTAATRARGEILVILDDDMQLPPGFLAEHLRLHREGPGRTCVMGRYASDPDIAQMPIFERYYANFWDKLTDAIKKGSMPVVGTILSTGNASMRREDYLKVGGFDLTLKQSEDTELGLKLEHDGVRMVFSDVAYTLHGSDHTQLEKWLRRNYNYGIYDLRIARKHTWAAHADPWRYLFSLPKPGVPFLVVSLVTPKLGKRVSGAMMRIATAVDKLGLEPAAMRATGVVFGMEYFRGVRDESGGLVGALSSLADFLAKAADADVPLPGVPKALARAARALRREGPKGDTAPPKGAPSGASSSGASQSPAPRA